MPDANHPIWALSRIAVMSVLAGALLYFSASHPDKTEVKAWLGIVMSLLMTELGVKAVKAAGKKE